MTTGTLALAYPLGTDILVQFRVRIGTSVLIGRINNDISPTRFSYLIWRENVDFKAK